MEKDLSKFLKVDLPVFLESSNKSMEFKFHTKIIGWRKGSFIALRTPVHRGFRVSIPQDVDISVRFFSEGSLFVFTTRVSFYISSPIFATFIFYPETFDEIKVRRYDRIQVYIPVEAFDEGKKVEGTFLDLSLGGALFVTKNRFDQGKTLSFSFYLPDGNKMTNVLAEVRSVRSSESGFHMHGLKFVRMSADDEKKIRKFFEEVKKAGKEGVIWVSQPL